MPLHAACMPSPEKTFWGVPITEWTEREFAVYAHSQRMCLLTALFITAGIAAWVALMPPAATNEVPAASLCRALASTALALTMLMAAWMNLFGSPPMKATAQPYPLVAKFGSTVFLTTWIIVLQTCFAVSTAVAEVAALTPTPLAGLLATCYSSTLFISTNGAMVTLLYLRMVHFQKGWRETMLAYWRSRGFPLERNSLMTHCPSLLVAVLDLVVKEPIFLWRCAPPFFCTMLGYVVFVFTYWGWLNICWCATNTWPYPFLVHPLSTCLRRQAFVVAVIVIGSIIYTLMYGLLSLTWLANGLPVKL
eukprot:NODE_10362_length_1357_cov_7.960163.p1 GENE.NODE_10362_length_1357_cov_7.960163~~NODE_10362_length_1357_cov_7.960163.p1  ORF type:complete len:338 (+),score=89.37 NODE_10362_length_1357_cov_7.960163:99-1016(+)